MGLDILGREWHRTTAYQYDEPGSDTFHQYIFWRRVSVVWACATIEAFVNEEGVITLGEKFYISNVERGRIEQKIQLLYALKFQKMLPTDAPELTQVKRLFDLRNQIVHPKTRSVTKEREGEQRQSVFHDMEFRDLRVAVWGITGLFEPIIEDSSEDDESL